MSRLSMPSRNENLERARLIREPEATESKRKQTWSTTDDVRNVDIVVAPDITVAVGDGESYQPLVVHPVVVTEMENNGAVLVNFLLSYFTSIVLPVDVALL
jgi:hypothetical protein